MTPAAPLVAAIILNWNGAEDTIRAVTSLAASSYARLKIVVVDNGSRGNDVAILEARCGAATVLALPANHGFGRAINIASAEALRRGADYLLLFNNDAFIPDDLPVIAMMVEQLERDPKLGAIGPIIVDDDEGHTVQAAGFFLRPAFPIPIAVGKGLCYAEARRKTFRFGYLQGSCLLLRAAAFASINGMDPDFFFLAEDADLMIRLARAGFGAALMRDAYVVHRKSSSIKAGSDNYIYASLRSNLIYLKKHARWYERPTAALTMLAISLALAALSWMTRRELGFTAIARAWRDFFAHQWGGHDGTWPPGYIHPDFAAIWNERNAPSSETRSGEC
jgi:GT2 family glycosyltransferase